MHEVEILTYRKKGWAVFLIIWAVASSRKPRAHTPYPGATRMSFDIERHGKAVSRYPLQLATQIVTGSVPSFK